MNLSSENHGAVSILQENCARLEPETCSVEVEGELTSWDDTDSRQILVTQMITRKLAYAVEAKVVIALNQS